MQYLVQQKYILRVIFKKHYIMYVYYNFHDNFLYDTFYLWTYNVHVYNFCFSLHIIVYNA